MPSAPVGQALSDVSVAADAAGGKITAVEPHDPARAIPEGTAVIEGRNRIVVPSFSDVHVHLDSTRIGLPFREHTGGPGVWAMMMNDRLNWRNAEVPLQNRVNLTLERMIARGTTRCVPTPKWMWIAGWSASKRLLLPRRGLRVRPPLTSLRFPKPGCFGRRAQWSS